MCEICPFNTEMVWCGMSLDTWINEHYKEYRIRNKYDWFYQISNIVQEEGLAGVRINTFVVILLLLANNYYLKINLKFIMHWNGKAKAIRRSKENV